MDRKEKNKQVVKISVFITSIFVIFLSISYAFINQTLRGTKRQVIVAGNLQLELKEKDAITLENALPMYDEVGMFQKSFDFTLTNKTAEDTNYTIKLKDITTNSNKLDTTLVKFGLTKNGEVTKNLLSNLTDNIIDTGIIGGEQSISYSLRLWIDSNVENEDLLHGKSLSYQLEVSAILYSDVAPGKSIVFDTASENLGENCKTYDDGDNTFFVGQCNQNYVWYSGKLWRIVLKNNETGATKMVTDNSITEIAYNVTGDATFENSYVDQWLQQDFLPTLHDYEDYLVLDSVFDVTPNIEGTEPVYIRRTAGLLNIDEYYTVFENSDGLATYANNYLNTSTYWWTLTPASSTKMLYVVDLGIFNSFDTNRMIGVRPTINLQSSIAISSGDGSITHPYKLVGDEQETTPGETLLSTRYSGEYVHFGDTNYRIVSIEDGKTKITALNSVELTEMNVFDSSTTNFSESSIKNDLQKYYENTIPELYRAMIEENTTWYLGMLEDNRDYKSSICATVNSDIGTLQCDKTETKTTATVGLPRVGEMFTSQFSRDNRTRFWTLTPINIINTTEIVAISANGLAGSSSPSDDYITVRPSMYLKSNVVISKDNTGDGTYESPYDIELLAS